MKIAFSEESHNIAENLRPVLLRAVPLEEGSDVHC
jgi:hypothetical protein